MKPPDERPDTLVWLLSTLSLGRFTAAKAVPDASTATAAARRTILNVIECLQRVVGTNNTAPRVSRGSQNNGSKRGAAAPVESPRGYRLLRIGTFISDGLISFTR